MSQAPVVILETNYGSITILLHPDKAPNTVRNFIDYVNDGHYNGTIFHRVIPGFMIQGGGMEERLKQRDTKAPIANEGQRSSRNAQYAVAMARTGDPHSATAQFFINVADNKFLDHTSPTPQGWGYATFGEVTDGQAVVDAIGKVKTHSQGFHQDVPVDTVTIQRATYVGPNVDELDNTPDDTWSAPNPRLPSYFEVTSGGLTPLVPILDKASDELMVRSLARVIQLDGHDLLSAPLKMGRQIDLLGISSSRTLLNTGILDVTDMIDSEQSTLAVTGVYLAIPRGNETEYFRFSTAAFKDAAFRTGHSNRQLELEANFVFLFGDGLSTAHGAPSSLLQSVLEELKGAAVEPGFGEHPRIALQAKLAGGLRPELGDVQITASANLHLQANVNLDGFEQRIAEAFKDAYWIGYDLQAFRTNANRRVEDDVVDPAQFEPGYEITSHLVEGSQVGVKLTVGDQPGKGGANRRYEFSGFDTSLNASELPGSAQHVISILFQNGAPQEAGYNGITLEAYLAVAKHVLEGFQNGPFANLDNEDALQGVKRALEALKRRTKDRVARQVEGKLEQ